MLSPNAVGVQGLLTKDNAPSIEFTVWRNSAWDFEVIENGRAVGVFYRTVAPNQHTIGVPGNYLSLEEVWWKCIAQRYPGYQPFNMEETTL